MCVPVFEIVSQVSLTTVYGYHKLELNGQVLHTPTPLQDN